MQLLGDIGNMTDIGGHIISHLAVTACEGLDELSVPVAQTNCSTVEFQLAAPVETASFESLGCPCGKFFYLAARIGIGK